MFQQLKVPRMVYSGCVNAITQAIKTVDSTVNIQADSKTKLVSVETQASATAIKEAIAAIGYPSI